MYLPVFENTCQKIVQKYANTRHGMAYSSQSQCFGYFSSPRDTAARNARIITAFLAISHCLVFRSDIFFADSVSASFAASCSFSGSFADSCSPSAGTGMGVFLLDGWAN